VISLNINITFIQKAGGVVEMEKPDALEMQRKWNLAFPSDRPQDRLLVMVVWDNYLSKHGDIRREVHIRLKAMEDGFNRYVWRIPHLTKNSRPFAIRARRNQELLPFHTEIKEEAGKSVTEVTVLLNPLKKNEETFFSIEYFEDAYIENIKYRLFNKISIPNLFFTKWRYDWIYKFYSPTLHFEKRLYFPKSSRIDLKKISPPLSTSDNISNFNDQTIYISKVENPNPGDNVGGQIFYKILSPALPATISIATGVALSLSIPFIVVLPWYLVALIITSSVFIAHQLIERLE
jgi:hypothetical protein